MANAKKTDTAKKAEAKATSLELVVTKNITGILETNIDGLEKFVDDKLKNYTPELYLGDADTAKKDRAELNNSKKFLSQSRIQLMNELMKPYSDFETRCKALEKKIDMASGKLDEIVKAKESEEKAKKQNEIQNLWNSKNFSLVPLEKIENKSWLNKTVKLSDVSTEIDNAISKIYSELKLIEKYSDDAETLKAHYLDCLNISDTLDYGEELKKNREKVAQEKAEREAREHNAQIEQQKNELYQENIHAEQNNATESLASQALGEKEEPKETVSEYVVSIKATKEQLNRLKSAMNALYIEFNVEELEF